MTLKELYVSGFIEDADEIGIWTIRPTHRIVVGHWYEDKVLEVLRKYGSRGVLRFGKNFQSGGVNIDIEGDVINANEKDS